MSQKAKTGIKVQDVAELFLHFADGSVKFFGCMNTAGLEKTVDTEDIRCGIGWGLSNILYSNPDMSLTLTPAYWSDVFLEVQSGEEFAASGSVNVWTYEIGTAVLSTTNSTVTITGTPVGGIVRAQTADGVTYPATFATGTATITGGAALAGKQVTIMYQKAVTGDVLTLKTDSYPKVMGVTLHTIAYDVATNNIVSDLYFTFDRVLGDGNLSLAMTGGTNNVGEMTVRVLPTNGNIFGKYTSVPRA
jgi:hypothetical protein